MNWKNSKTSSARKNPIPRYALLVVNAVGLVGNVFSLMAISWFVLQTSGSAVHIGITSFLAVAPAVLAGCLGGTLIDRLDYSIGVTAQGLRIFSQCILYVYFSLSPSIIIGSIAI